MCSLPKCSLSVVLGGLCDLMTLEAISVENFVPGGYNSAGQDFLAPLQVAIYVVQNPPCWRAKVALGQD